MKVELTAAQLTRAIECANFRIQEADARAQRETAPHLVAMFAKSAKTEAPKVEKKRCAHWAAIREFFAVAREMGLDAQNNWVLIQTADTNISDSLTAHEKTPD